MAEEKSATQFRDMLDIIFANRNKAYGAYKLRREYPWYLGRALIFGVLLIGFFLILPMLLSLVSKLAEQADKPVDVVAELGPPPDIDPNNPPPPPPPPPPTPPPPTRSTVRFVPPVIDEDKNVAEEAPPPAQSDLANTNKDIGNQDKEGNNEAAPSVDENPAELAVVEPVVAPVEEKTYELFDIQKQPSFPGGEAEMYKFIKNNMVYPQIAIDNNIVGVVPVSFVVNKDGSISDVQVLKDIGGGCGKEAVRVVKAMPGWSPGEANGHKVKVRYTLPIRFKLD